MSTNLKGHESWTITGSWKTSMTVDEMAQFVLENGGGGGGVTIEEVNTAIDTKISGKADSNNVVTKVAGRKGDVTLTKSDVGLNKVDNTSDAEKPVSTAQKAAIDLKASQEDFNVLEEHYENLSEELAINHYKKTAIDAKLDKKVDLLGLLKTIDSTPAQIHTGETQVDVFNLDYGQHLIRTNNAINTPPDTSITLIDVIKTHDEVGGGTGIKTLLPVDFEQGTVAETSPVGTDYALAKYPATEPLHGSRIRNINPIEINEFSTVSVAAGYQYCVLAFDGNQKYLGRSTYMSWDTIPRLTYPDALYIAVAVKKLGTNVPITTADATEAKLTITTLGSAAGGSKLVIAWGATQGDLHTCVNIAGAWSSWRKIGTQLPQDAEEGSTLEFRGGKWVAVPPAVPQNSDPIEGV